MHNFLRFIINTSLRKKADPLIVKLQNWINLICNKVKKKSYILFLDLSTSREMEKSDTPVYETVVSLRITVAKLLWPCWGHNKDTRVDSS